LSPLLFHSFPTRRSSDLQVRKALDEQFIRFEELIGQRPTHLDSHHNVHRDPRALPHFLALAEEHVLPLREHSPVRYFSKFYGQRSEEHTSELQSRSDLVC